MEYFKLSNQVKIPAINYGTFPMTKFTCVKALNCALRNGYEGFDTAHAYYNEKWCKFGMMLSMRKRENLFITTKISNVQQRSGDVESALHHSLKELGLKYIDLYLMHWPNPETYLRTWKSMERLYKDGLVKAIGVCNFHQHHLESLMEVADIMPMVNQVEIHPLLSQRELVNFCKDNSILVEAYSPLARNNPQLMKNDVLIELGKKYSKSVAQVILRWDYQNHIVSVPKSGNPDRMRNNISIFDFELTESEMSKIDALNKNMRIRHDPDNCDFSKL